MGILVVGNCQAEVVAECLSVVTGRGDIRGINVRRFRSGDLDAEETLSGAEAALVQAPFWGRHVPPGLRGRPGLLRIPSLFFNGFHPDFVFPAGARSLFGRASSSLCLHGWLRGMTVQETAALYRAEVFDALGWLDGWRDAVAAFVGDAAGAGFDLAEPVEQWRRAGSFMYTPNHPELKVSAEIARQCARLLGLPVKVALPERMLPDRFAADAVWAIYPEVAAAIGVPAQPWFKVTGGFKGLSANLHDLPSFIAASFARYAEADPAVVSCRALEDPRFAAIAGLAAGRRARNPYRDLPAHRFWRKSVAAPPPGEVDPVVRAGFPIAVEDRVATAGSCFAQHVARRLKDGGFTYFVPEDGATLDEAEQRRRNYGVFSARYGNLYTPRQLLQLLDRAEGRFAPAEDAWRRGERWVDPFRPEIEPDGFATVEDLRASREEHLAAVRRMWRETDVFVFTLGLTESWRSLVDGAVVPVAPGVAGDPADQSAYGFHNFSAAEVVADLRAFLARVRVINPRLRVILTVSPVPLVATYEDRHVLVSTTYSKSVLRVAAEEVSRAEAMVDYFPSYEIITGGFNRGAYFAEDLRSVLPEGVDHVMRVFLRHYTGTGAPAAAPAAPATWEGRDAVLREAREVVCEEELLDAP